MGRFGCYGSRSNETRVLFFVAAYTRAEVGFTVAPAMQQQDELLYDLTILTNYIYRPLKAAYCVECRVNLSSFLVRRSRAPHFRPQCRSKFRSHTISLAAGLC
jgi:hypothetical protein